MSHAELPPSDPQDQTTLSMPIGSTSQPAEVPSQTSLTQPQMGAFGDYELVQIVGRGGMGVVYKACQTKLRRTVALKMILGGKLASEQDLKRFLAEAEAAARLRHRNIVTIFEIGAVQGQHYFSMEFIEGETLAQRLTGGPLPGRKAAHYMQRTARAVHYAHAQGVVHRDLKPSNIMLDGEDEPLVTDFGLAKRLDSTQSLHTQTGAILGTPSYMAPEQAAGRSRDIGPASDVYSLGAVLYELLTGRPPFQSDTHLDTLIHVLHTDPVPPRLLNPKVDADLETICLKCLEKPVSARYANAEELADDLERYLNGEAISVRSFNIFDRLTRILDRSQHDVAFHTWSNMLFLLAPLILFEHVLVFFLSQTDAPDGLLFLARFSQFVLLGVIFWFNRGNQLFPRTAAERELWTIWIGYIIFYVGSVVVVRFLVQQGILTAGASASPQWDNLILYPISSLLAGLAFFVMGSNYWGRCYAFGVGFLVLAIATTFQVEWSPLAFGLLWAIILINLGWRLRRFSAQAEADKRMLQEHDTLTFPGCANQVPDDPTEPAR